MTFVAEHLSGRPELVRQVFEWAGVAFSGRSRGHEWRVLCPFHPDEHPSLDVNDEKATFMCRACGAGGDAVEFFRRRKGLADAATAIRELRERGIGNGNVTRPSPKSTAPAAPKKVVRTTLYEIRDVKGTLVAVHKRIDYDDGTKDLPWLQPNGSPGLNGIKVTALPLYNSELIRTWRPDELVILTEGEKAADALTQRGYHAVGTVTGADKKSKAPDPAVLEVLRGLPVVMWRDFDENGLRHMDICGERLLNVAKSLRTFVWARQPKDDAWDFFERDGGTADQLDGLLAEAPAWKPATTATHKEQAPGEHPLVVTWDEFVAEQYPPVPSLWGDAFLVKGGGYLIMGGDTGVGKTILVSNLIFALVAGMDEFLGFPLPGRPVPVLFLEAEGSRQKFRDRLQQIAEHLGVRRAGLPLFFHRADAALSVKTLGDMIEQSRVELAFLDPVGRFYSGNENLTEEWRGMVTHPLAKLATSHSTAFVLSDHYSKPNEARSGQHKIRGSAAKVQDCGAALRLEIGRAGGGSRILFFDRVRDGAIPFPEMDPSRMALEINVTAGTVALDEREGAEDALAVREARVADVVEVVRASGAEISTKDLLAGLNERTGLEKSRANDLIVIAKASKLIEQPRRGFYRLPGNLLGATTP